MSDYIPSRSASASTTPTLAEAALRGVIGQAVKNLKDKTEAELNFTIDVPGSYLLRLETRDSVGTEGHEHYAALDVVVK